MPWPQFASRLSGKNTMKIDTICFQRGGDAGARSMNFEGLRRRGFSADRISAVKAMHKTLYRDGLTLEQAKLGIADLSKKYPESMPDVQMMLSFLEQASPQRGIVR